MRRCYARLSMAEEQAGTHHDSAFGANLLAARQRCKLSLREVQERTEALTREWNHPDFRISAAWLNRVERGRRGLTAARLVALTAIYGITPDEMYRMFFNQRGSAEQIAKAIGPNSTMIVRSGPMQDHARDLLPDLLILAEPPEETHLLPRAPEMREALVRAVIGKRDKTMEPMIRAGSYILIDTDRRMVGKKVGGLNEFERPIHFLLTRDSYLTGFCEIDRDGEYLTLEPHPLSPVSSRRMRFRKEVEVVGTVVGIAMRLRET